MKKKILFVHQHFPGQYKHLAPALAEKYNVHSFSMFPNDIKGVKHHRYTPHQESSKNIHRLAVEFETKILRAEACADLAYKLKDEGFNPDLIIGHAGWGELLFIKEVWPNSKLLSYLEFHYKLYNSDIDFDKDHMVDEDKIFLRRKLISRNAAGFSQYSSSDYLITPTEFQKSTFPEFVKEKITVIHEGIDTDVFTPNEKMTMTVDNVTLSRKDKIILFVNRNLEPYRGYHIFLRSLPYIQKKHPDALILIVGADGTSYGKKPPQGQTWKNIFLNEVKDQVDLSKIIFTGYLLEHKSLTALMQMASVQVYLSYPFVVSWSLLESLSCGCLVIGSNTEPVSEIITDKKNGILTDFFDYKEIANKVNAVLDKPENYNKLTETARQHIIKNYDLKKVCLPKTIEFVENILSE